MATAAQRDDVESRRDGGENERRPLLEKRSAGDGGGGSGGDGMSPVQRAISQTYQSTAHLAKLLPTGTVLAFQLLSPIVTNQGHCDVEANRAMAGALIALCALSCFVLSFTDSFRDAATGGAVRYAGRRGVPVAATRPGARRRLRDGVRRRRAVRPERGVVLLPGAIRGHEAGAHGAADRHRRRREHAVRELPDHTPWHRVPTLAALIFSRILPARTPICAYPRLSSLDH
uniref:Uncharacterized protein n=1 Tax=Oryza barthii TaxID=65489 RepID=A0A0D3GAT1_9ORYZ